MDRLSKFRRISAVHYQRCVCLFFSVKKCIIDERTCHSLALPTLHTRLSQKSKASGAPTLLFVTSAALRVADVTRSLKSKKLRGEKGGDVAKLFAKHFKLAEHVSYLKRTKVGAAVGTPGRIGKLLCETGTSFLSSPRQTEY